MNRILKTYGDIEVILKTAAIEDLKGNPRNASNPVLRWPKHHFFTPG